jgi:hypothetical protein
LFTALCHDDVWIVLRVLPGRWGDGCNINTPGIFPWGIFFDLEIGLDVFGFCGFAETGLLLGLRLDVEVSGGLPACGN